MSTTDPQTFVDLPMPGDHRFGGIVIASTWLRDGWSRSEREIFVDEPEFLGLVMVLNPTPPYYTVAQIMSQTGEDAWVVADSSDHPNINPATDDYAQSGGDY